MQAHYGQVMNDVEAMRREIQALRLENARFRESASHGGVPPPSQPPPPASSAGGHSAQHHHHHQQPPPPPQTSATTFSDPFASGPRTELPPLRSLGAGGSLQGAPESMTGVQYEAPRSNGYRDGRF